MFRHFKNTAKVNLVNYFVLESIEFGSCGYFSGDENNTGMERSVFVCTKNDMVKLKGTLQKKHSFDSWTSEKVNTKSNFQTPNVKSFAALLKYIPMVYGGNLSNEPSLKNHSVIFFTLDRESHDTTLWGQPLFVQITGTLFEWLRQVGRIYFRILLYFLTNFEESYPESFKVFSWMVFEKLKTYCSPTCFIMILISLTENSFASLHNEVSGIVMKFSSFYVTTITFSASTKPTQ